MKGDIIVNVHFFTLENGGRKGPTPSGYFGCLFTIGGENFDCRLLLQEHGAISPGDKVKVPVKFLNYDNVSKLLKKNAVFTLWDGGAIAEGTIDELINTLS